jgi:hypothetical protein
MGFLCIGGCDYFVKCFRKFQGFLINLLGRWLVARSSGLSLGGRLIFRTNGRVVRFCEERACVCVVLDFLINCGFEFVYYSGLCLIFMLWQKFMK